MKDKIPNVIMGICILALIGAGYREYLIHNGKLTSDLNANGYSITNLPARFFPAETDPTVPSWAKEAAPPSGTEPYFHKWLGGATNDMGVISAAESAMFAYTLGGPAEEVAYSAGDITAISKGFAAADASLSSRLSLASLAATNYTDSAISAAIAPANLTFSNAVLAVGLNIDTDAVAALNEIAADFGGFPLTPGSAATTVGGLLAALAAAVAWLRKNKADAATTLAGYGITDAHITNGVVTLGANSITPLTSHQQLRYAMPASVALVAENNAATLVCGDRAVTNATIASGFATLNLTFPAEVSGYVRDFYLRITVAAGESAPALSLPQGVTIENAGGAVPEIADGEASAAATTLVWFSETAPGVFTAKSETVKAVV